LVQAGYGLKNSIVRKTGKNRKENPDVFSATMEWKRNETAFSYIKRVSNKVFTDFVLPEATFFLETPDLL
jgi:hypothetical protein